MANRLKFSRFFFISFVAVFKKELLHILRSPDIIVFSIFIPVFELFMIGYALDINVRKIDTVVYDLSQSQESRQLVQEFANTSDFRIVSAVNSDAQMYDTIVSGRAKVVIKIPSDYTRQLLIGKTTYLQVLIDGSNAPVTIEAVNTSNAIALQNSIKHLLSTDTLNGAIIPVEMRAIVLFNPDSKTANFFLPGVISFESSLLTIILAGISLVVEREKGTLEQLFMTPLNFTGMVLGKVLPYGLFAVIQVIVLLGEMHYGFKVPIQGSVILLILLSLPYIFICLSLGIMVAALTDNQVASIQLGTLFRILPAIYLSGYIFPIEGMPLIFQKITTIIPEWHYIEICRGIILRGATLEQLASHVVALLIISLVVFVMAIMLYRRKLKA